MTDTGWEGVTKGTTTSTTVPNIATVIQPVPEPAPAPAPAPAPEPTPAPAPVDNRQRWTCVYAEGPRTKLKADGPPCPVFHSDAHLMNPPELVRCPTCGGASVRRSFDGEV